MSRRFVPAAAALAAALIVAGCAIAPPRTAYPELSYSHLGTIALDVAAVEVVEDYRAPLADPNVDHLFPTPPATAVRRWAADRLRPVGGAGAARVVIREASVVEVPLTRRTGLAGVFTTDQSERYDARLSVEIVADRPDRRRSAFAGATVTRSVSVPEDLSLAEREQVWIDLTDKLMQELDRQLEQGIRANLAPMMP